MLFVIINIWDLWERRVVGPTFHLSFFVDGVATTRRGRRERRTWKVESGTCWRASACGLKITLHF